MEANLLKLDMLGHDDPTMVRMMEDLTGVNARQIPLDDPDTMSIFTSSKVLGYENDEILGPTGAVAIPEFNTRFTRQMLVDTQPKDFNTLVRLSGFSHGTDVWLRHRLRSGDGGLPGRYHAVPDLQGPGPQDELQDHGEGPQGQGEEGRL